MTCTLAAIVYFLGSMPEPGTVITVPRSSVARMTITQQAKARMCARKYGIQWRIDETL